MAKIRMHKITSSWPDAEVVLRVDHDKLTPCVAQEINSFWGGADSRLAAADDDVVLAVIKYAGLQFLYMVFNAEDDFNETGMQHQFDDREGWGGSDYNGIEIVSFEGRPEFDVSDLEHSDITDAGDGEG